MEKEILVDDPNPAPWFTRQGLGIDWDITHDIVRQQWFDQETGAPLWTKQGLGKNSNKVLIRTNDGDVRAFDKDKVPEELQDKYPWFLWFVKGNFDHLDKLYKERVGYDESQEIKEAWFTPLGIKKRFDRWESLKPKSNYNAPWYTPRFWKEFGYMIRENMDNEFYRNPNPYPTIR